jgi:hypothetical protein
MAYPTRLALAWRWSLFLLIWIPATALIHMATVNGGPCGDAGQRIGSPRNSYCKGVHDYWGWTGLHAVPMLLPIAVLVAIGLVGVSLRHTTLLKWSSIVFAISSLLYLVIPRVLSGAPN